MGNCIFLRRGAPPSSGPQLGDLEPGTLISLEENGAQVPFIVLTHDYPAAERTLVIREKAYHTFNWGTNGDEYYESAIDSYCENTYLPLIDIGTRQYIDAVMIGSWMGYGSSSHLISRKCFLLSYMEVGYTSTSETKKEGQAIPYFVNKESRRAYDDSGDQVIWWLRTNENTADAWTVNKSGNRFDTPKRTSLYVRPAFTLPVSMKPIIWEDV